MRPTTSPPRRLPATDVAGEMSEGQTGSMHTSMSYEHQQPSWRPLVYESDGNFSKQSSLFILKRSDGSDCILLYTQFCLLN